MYLPFLLSNDLYFLHDVSSPYLVYNIKPVDYFSKTGMNTIQVLGALAVVANKKL